MYYRRGLFKNISHRPMNPSPQSQSCDSYRPDIDGLRAIAVISVVFFHGFPSWVKGGYTGVDIFFVISGYLISSTIYSGLQNNNFSFYAFYSSRIRRIMPALLLVLFSIYILGWFILSAYEYQQLGKHISAGAFFISNFVLWGESGYFDASAETKLLLHLWSLGIEEQFYIFWPLVLWATWKVFGKKHWVIFIILIISFSLNVIGIRQDIVGTFYSPLTRFWELLSGGILAWLMFHKNNILQPPKKGETINLFDKYILFKIQENRRIPLLNAISILGILLLLFSLWITSKASGFPGHLELLSI
jgi:peptidoglycan/LPS O-acetylase OafA/YrhL